PLPGEPMLASLRRLSGRRTLVPIVLSAALLVPTGIASADPAAPDGAGSGQLDLDAATIPALQQQMNGHRLTAVQLTQAYLNRIQHLDPQLGAVLAVNRNALQDAAASDQLRANQGPRSALEGIPVLLKDNVDTTGMPTTAGSRALANSRPQDATLTRKLRQA